MAESSGARLKKLRLEKGISLEEVHKKTKIHLNVLRAIEEDSLINFNPIYISGFIKIYCQFLGQDPKDYVVRKEIRSQPPRVISNTPEAQPAPFRKLESLNFESSRRPGIKFGMIFRVALVIVFIFGLFKLGKMISAKRAARPKVEKKAVLASAPAKSKKKEAAPQKSAQKKQNIIPLPIEPKQAASPGRPVAPSIIRLGIRAREDCWVQLKVDGHTVFQNILKRGRYESWQAKQKIDLSLGNAGVVDLEVNGRMISSLGRRGQVLKNILISQEGLTIPR
jgi:cytoskeletal protein RodZ